MSATARVVPSIAKIAAADWDALANPPARQFNPFVAHAFLKALEESGSAVAEEGWQPAHIAIEEGGRLTAAAPAYVKSHSQGEYVFDWGWADAFQRAGGRYYPKYQISVPFTPATGPRLLAPDAAGKRALLQAAADVAGTNKLSSVHITFQPEADWKLCGAEDWLLRMDRQFHWANEGYGSFDDFLARLNSDKRKNLKKERKRALEPGIEIEWVTGSDLAEKHWDAFFAFYMDTGGRKWGSPYLTRSFFSLIGETMAEHTLLVMAKRGGRYIAGALNFIGGDTLFGRNWGALEHHPFLHFECCYYQAIDFAIARGLKRVEAGAQGEHKLLRGYAPCPTYSAHFITHSGLRRAVGDYLERERRAVVEDIEILAEHTPFKSSERNA
ncbi:MAG: N-acetyltransferase [Alphaproteobacteria bacterium]|nr:N-acetyltransferase [Alphaproteobacteria bacterium]